MPARKPTAEALPAVTETDTPSPDAAIIASISVRIYNPHLKATYQVTFGPDATLDSADNWVALWIEQGYIPCLSPDAPQSTVPAAPTTVPATDRYPPAYENRPGRRVVRSKAERLTLPFALKGQYKGWSLDEIEADNPPAIDWLAKNSFMDDIRKAAQKIVNQRDEDAPF